MATISPHPTPDQNGPMYSRFFEPPPDYDAVTTAHEYEDGGKSFNLDSEQQPRSFEISYDGLSELEAQILDDHYDEAKGQINDFTFTHPRTGEEIEGVHYLSYERSHEKTWMQTRRVVLIRYPDFEE